VNSLQSCQNVPTTNHIFPISQKHWGQYEEERNVRLSLTSLMNIPPYLKAGGKKICWAWQMQHHS